MSHILEGRGCEEWFPGMMDNVIISDHPLSPAEIIGLDVVQELNVDNPLAGELIARFSSLDWKPMGSGEIMRAIYPGKRGGLTQEQWETLADPAKEGIWSARLVNASR